MCHITFTYHLREVVQPFLTLFLRFQSALTWRSGEYLKKDPRGQSLKKMWRYRFTQQ